MDLIPPSLALIGVALCWRSVRLEQSASLRARMEAAAKEDVGKRVEAAVDEALGEYHGQLDKLRQDIRDERSRASMRGR